MDLDWEAPAGCPQAGAVRARVRALVGDSKTILHLRAQGRVVRVDGRYRLTLSLDEGGAGGSRTIDSPSCADLAGAAAVALGLWLQRAPTSSEPSSSPSDATSGDRSANNGENGDESPAGTASRDGANGAVSSAADKNAPGKDAAATSDEPKRSPPETSEAEPRAEPASPRQWRPFVRAPAATLEAVRLPTPSLGLGADLGIRYREWRFGGGARIFRAQTLWSSQFADIGAKIQRFTVQAWTCRRSLGTRFELAPCVSVGVEHLGVSGVGPNVASRSEQATFLAFGGGGNAYFYPASWMALVGSATLSFASARPRLTIDGIDELRQLGPVVLGVGLASEWIF
jgi:hypothetical protein